jgi:hypothetical protein
MSHWKVGLVAAVLAGVVGVGCGGVEPVEEAGPSATQRYLEQLEGGGGGGGGEPPNKCGEKICFPIIRRDKNITHIFLDFGMCPIRNFRVFLKTAHRGTEEVTDRLKTRGGPCKELDADYHFEVQGPDREAQVCIIFEDYITRDVRIGAKSANECRYDIGDALKAFDGGGGGGGGGGGECPGGDCRKCPKH